MANFKDAQKEEAKTWLIQDPILFKDKKQRETIRYPLLKKQMGLNYLDTSDMTVYDVGAGPFGGVSSIIRAKDIYRVEPLKEEYAKIANVDGYIGEQAERVDYRDADLVICTNAMDHFDSPRMFLLQLKLTMKYGAYFAHFHAIDNAITHKHKAHQHNVNQEIVREILNDDFELVWEMDYQNDGLTYAWRKQPAFAQLWRKTTGYNE